MFTKGTPQLAQGGGGGGGGGGGLLPVQCIVIVWANVDMWSVVPFDANFS